MQSEVTGTVLEITLNKCTREISNFQSHINETSSKNELKRRKWGVISWRGGKWEVETESVQVTRESAVHHCVYGTQRVLLRSRDNNGPMRRPEKCKFPRPAVREEHWELLTLGPEGSEMTHYKTRRDSLFSNYSLYCSNTFLQRWNWTVLGNARS